MTRAEIAKQDGVGVATVNISIAQVSAYRGRYSSSAALSAQASIVIECAEVEKAALLSALQAKTKEQVGVDGDGDPVFDEVPNYQVVLQASEILTTKTSVIQPRASGKAINVQTNVGVVSQSSEPAAPPRGFTVEERLRDLQAKRQGLLTEGKQESTLLQPSPVEAYDAEAELLHEG